MSTRRALVFALSLAAAPELARAAENGPMSAPRLPTPTPEQEATELYNDAVSYRGKAEKHEKEAATEADPKKREKLEGKARKEHEAAIKKLTKATRLNPRMHQAFGNMGHSYRKIGDFNASLTAYDQALALDPTYTPAIEYRAEAYLGLGRLDEVKSAYMQLFSTDRPRADELAAAIDRWLEKKKADPSGVDPKALQDFTEWAAKRKQISSQTSSLTSGDDARW